MNVVQVMIKDGYSVVTNQEIEVETTSYFTDFVFINCRFYGKPMAGSGFKNCFFFDCNGELRGSSYIKLSLLNCNFVDCTRLNISNTQFYDCTVENMRALNNCYFLNCNFVDVIVTDISGITITNSKLFLDESQWDNVVAFNSYLVGVDGKETFISTLKEKE